MSKLKSVSCGILNEPKLTRVFEPAYATRKPNTPPRSPNNVLSVSNCRSKRPRFAPNAVRMAISLCLAVAFDRSRLAMLAQAISNTRTTAPSRISKASRTSPTICSCSGITTDSRPALTSGYSLARRLAIELISACACCGATPAFRRPIIFKLRIFRINGTSSVVNGTHKSAFEISSSLVVVAENAGGNLNVGGITPTTV